MKKVVLLAKKSSRVMAKQRKASYKFFQNKKCEFFPCHKIAKKEDFNCLFCYCPLYSMGKKCGGNYKYLADNTKDCSDCSLPHEYENYDLIMDKVAILVDQVKINDPSYKIKELLIATTNTYKITEIKSIIKQLNNKIVVKTLEDFKGQYRIPEETGNTFSDNAMIKAKYYGKLFQIPTIVDDSGLEIFALNNFPGVNSATWLKNDKLLKEDIFQKKKNHLIIQLVNDKCSKLRQARFKSVLQFYDHKINFNRVFVGIVNGHITKKIDKNIKSGFGYDPIFVVDKYKKVMSQLSLNEKNKISHRGKATLGFCSWLRFFS